MHTFHHTTRHDPALLMAVLYPKGYTPPPADPLDDVPRLHIAPLSVLDQDLDEASAYVAALSIRGRQAVSKTGCAHEDSDRYWSACADTHETCVEAARHVASTEPVVAALVLEINRRAQSHHVYGPTHLRAQVDTWSQRWPGLTSWTCLWSTLRRWMPGG
ncbi:hypothetical protein BN948_00162 [Hydrogenophaga intermedia]|uniref:Uncharacterized protein n=1 Tax=Hydrogenophaga intermedia TaxID=65786 RepID=A0A1L1PDD9_HYDIT|nr:hypothetical protein [Hydrogenophaga intermedia]CDN85769.1 hypothetical protein BN948_00162 [Hydrogenophaga intermedia]